MNLDWLVDATKERTADTAKARLVWILAKDRTEAKTRRMTSRDVSVMALDWLSDTALSRLTANAGPLPTCERIRFRAWP